MTISVPPLSLYLSSVKYLDSKPLSQDKLGVSDLICKWYCGQQQGQIVGEAEVDPT